MSIDLDHATSAHRRRAAKQMSHQQHSGTIPKPRHAHAERRRNCKHPRTRAHTRAHLYVHDNVLARRAYAQRQACARGPTCARARVQPARRAGGWRPGARTAEQTNEGFCPEKCTAGRIPWTDVWAGKRRAGGSAAGRCPRNGAQERCVGFCCQSTHGHFVTGTASIHSRR